MELYLMQHGEATAKEVNPDRPLTSDGRAAVEVVAARARTAGVQVEYCVHSGKLRAEETARLLMTGLGSKGSVEARAGLAPNDPAAPVAEWLQAMTQQRTLALVGHLPFLDKLASLLVAGDENAQILTFRMGALVKLEPKAEQDGFSVAWVLTPELV